jgi:hypothetical protein
VRSRVRLVALSTRRLAACAAVAVAGLAAACGSPGGPAGQPSGHGSSVRGSCASQFLPTGTSSREGPAWIITPGGLTKLKQAGLPAPLMADFNRPSTLLLASRGSPVPLAPRASLVYYYASAAALQTAIGRHEVPADVRFVLLDLERWPLTPRGEQADPIASLRAALAAARAARKCVVFAPAVDLIGPLPRGEGEFVRFLHFDRQVAAPGAIADVFVVQSQQTEGTAFATVFAPRAIAAVRTARPSEPVFAGLSTGPNGRRVTPAELLEVYRVSAAAGAVGYWLNIPETDAYCPACGSPAPQVAVAFLEMLARTGWR